MPVIEQITLYYNIFIYIRNTCTHIGSGSRPPGSPGSVHSPATDRTRPAGVSFLKSPLRPPTEVSRTGLSPRVTARILLYALPYLYSRPAVYD